VKFRRCKKITTRGKRFEEVEKGDRRNSKLESIQIERLLPGNVPGPRRPVDGAERTEWKL
jgi:hypothetical protein